MQIAKDRMRCIRECMGLPVPARDAANLDWTLIRSFLAVMREGTLTRAASALGLTQPTLGRHIRGIERMAGEPLFTRRGNRLNPTEAAQALFERGKDIEQAVVALGRAIVGTPDDMAGTVRITASMVLGVELLPRLLPGLLAAIPGLEVEVIARDTVDNLLRRDADRIRRLTPTVEDRG